MRNYLLLILFLILFSSIANSQQDNLISRWTDGFEFYGSTSYNDSLIVFYGGNLHKGGTVFTVKVINDQKYPITGREPNDTLNPSIGEIGGEVDFQVVNNTKVLIIKNANGEIQDILRWKALWDNIVWWNKGNWISLLWQSNLAYENADPTTEISAGAIAVHDGKDSIGRIAHGMTNEELNLDEISINPNPVREIVTIEFPSDYIINEESIELHLFNLTGVDMMNNNMKNVKNNRLELDILDLPAGIYILTTPNGDSGVKHKITKL